MSRCSLALVCVFGLVACTVRTGGPSGPPPGPMPPPSGSPAATPPPPGPAAPPMAEACPQELGADAPDTPDGAPSLDVGTHQGCYGVDDRKDTFALTAPAHAGPVLYNLRVSSATGTGCLVAMDADRAVIPRLNKCAKNKGAALDAWVVVMGGTPWFLETRDVSGGTLRRAEAYTLEIKATPLADIGEPDSMQAPVPLAAGEAKQAFLVNAANAKELDHDYFVVEVPKNMRKKTRFEVVVADVPTDAHVALQVFNADGKKLFSGSAPNAGATLRAEVKMKGPGRYIFHLRNIVGGNKVVGGADEPAYRATKPYSITVNLP